MSESADEELVYEVTEEDEEDEALPPSNYEIFSYPADTTLKGYLDQWDKDQLFIPRFQRNFVWDQTRASKLIESFLVGLPVPPVFLYKPATTKSFWIIGQYLAANMDGMIRRTPKSDIAKLVGTLDEGFRAKFNGEITDQQISLYSNIIQARHSIGHKQGSPIDLSEIPPAIQAADAILIALDNCFTD